MARVWQLLVKADGDTKAAQREIRALQKSTQQFGRRMSGMGKALTASVTAPIIAMGAVGVTELRETMAVTAKTDAVFKSMGDTMKVTKGQLSDLVSELEAYSAIEGDILQNAANVGLSFKALAGNPKLFEQTTRAAVDMSAALGTDIQQTMIQLGKAMQNGAKGAGALAKNGTLAKDDIAKLQKMAKDGVPIWKQQQFILAAVNKQYAGQGKNVDPIKAITIAFKNMAETMAVLLLPAITFVSTHVQRLSGWVNGLSESNKKLVGAFLLVAAALGPVLWALGSMISIAAPLTAALGLTVTGVLAIPIALAALGVALVVAYRKSETFRNIVNSAFKSVRTGVTQVLTSLRATIAQWIQWGTAIWSRWGSEIMSVVGPLFRSLATIVSTQMANIRDGIKIVLALLRGDWSQAWNLMKGIVERTWNAIKQVVQNSVQAVLAYIKNMGSMVMALGSEFYQHGSRLGKKLIDGIKDYVRDNAVSLGTEIAGLLGGQVGAAVDAAADAAGKSAAGGKRAKLKAKHSAALVNAQRQARIDADAGASYNQALRQYNAGVAAVADARKIKDPKKRTAAVAAAQAKLAQLAQNLVQKEQEKNDAADAKIKADREELAARSEANAAYLEAVDDARRDGFEVPADLAAADDKDREARFAKWLDDQGELRADNDKAEAERKKRDQDKRDADNFRRRALGQMSVEEEIELAAANEIRAQNGLPPVKSMSEIGSNPSSISSTSTGGAAGDTGAGFNGLMPSSASASAAVGSAAMRALGGITINGASDPEAVARRVAFILGGSRLRMGGSF